jgi:DNA-binding IclR family transcriptional regulator
MDNLSSVKKNIAAKAHAKRVMISKPSVQHRSTSRILDILELVADCPEEKQGYVFTEIAEILKIPKSSISPILHTLLARKYLTIDPVSSRYHIGSRLYATGMGYINQGRVLRDIQHIMSAIVGQVTETCHFAELNGGDVFYLLKVDTPEPIRMISTPGRTLPAYSTGLGKALLSDNGTREELQKLYPAGLNALTPNTITDVDVLLRQLKKVRETGFAFESGESTPHIRCIAVPVKVYERVRYAMSVAIPVFRYSKEKEARICAVLKDARSKIEAIL